MSSTSNESEKIEYFQANFSKNGPDFRLSRHFQRVHITSSKILLDENLVSECSHRSKLQIEPDLRIFSKPNLVKYYNRMIKIRAKSGLLNFISIDLKIHSSAVDSRNDHYYGSDQRHRLIVVSKILMVLLLNMINSKYI